MDEYTLSLLLSDIEFRLLRSMKRNMEKYIENVEFQSSAEWNRWQIEQLAAIDTFRRDSQGQLHEDMMGFRKAVAEFLQLNYKDGLKEEEIKVLDAIAKGADYKRPNIDAFFGFNTNRFKALVKESNEICDKIEYAMLRSTTDLYRKVIQETSVSTITGTPLWTAVDEAVGKFTQNGITKVQYRDGKNVNIASYSEMALRTCGVRSENAGQAEVRDQIGLHLVITSKYSGCSKLCWHVQGRVFRDNVYSQLTDEEYQDTKYPLLSDAMDGTIEGSWLFHPNCRHSISSYYEGITKVEDITINKKENDREYELEQKQRYYERQIRNAKKQEELAMTDEYKNKYKKKVRHYQELQRNLVKENSFLRRDYAREKVRV